MVTEAHRQSHAHAHTHARTRIAEGLRPALTGLHGRVRGANIKSARQDGCWVRGFDISARLCELVSPAGGCIWPHRPSARARSHTLPAFRGRPEGLDEVSRSDGRCGGVRPPAGETSSHSRPSMSGPRIQVAPWPQSRTGSRKRMHIHMRARASIRVASPCRCMHVHARERLLLGLSQTFERRPPKFAFDILISGAQISQQFL